jgi:cobalt transporter subunit CbtB
MIDAIASTVSTRLGDRLLAGLLTLTFGLLLLAGAGFAGSDVVHNAAHDTRHALGFPCH